MKIKRKKEYLAIINFDNGVTKAFVLKGSEGGGGVFHVYKIDECTVFGPFHKNALDLPEFLALLSQVFFCGEFT